jgi:phenylacetic acid degradation operon negative regulatory protein
LLRSEVRHGRRGYALTGQALALIAQVDARIFTPPPRPRLRDGWVVVSVSVPEAERSRRHLLRNRLTWLGLSGLDGGLWFGPAHRRDEVVASLDLLDLRGAAHVFIAHYDGSGEVADLVRRSWDLDAVEKAYLRFTDVHGPVWERARRAPVDDQRAFVDYTLAVHDWRPLPLDDPALPTELLPADWPGVAAAAVFAGLRRRLEPAAFRFVASVVA